MNPLFKLLSTTVPNLTDHYNISSKTSLSGAKYYLLEGKNATLPKIMLNEETYEVTDFHISVYENFIAEDRNASFHITINLKNNKQLLTARIYFNSANKIIFDTVKDVESQAIEIKDKNSFSQWAQEVVYPFSYHTAQHLSILKNHFCRDEAEFVQTLEKLSEGFNVTQNIEDRKQTLIKYIFHLEKLITLLKEWQMFEPYARTAALKYFIVLHEKITHKLYALSASIPASPIHNKTLTDEPTESDAIVATSIIDTPKKVFRAKPSDELDDINQQLANLKLSEKLSQPAKLVKEHLLLTKKFNVVRSDDDVLNCILRIRAIEREAHNVFHSLLQSLKAYRKTTKEELDQLIKIIPDITLKDFMLATENDRATALALLIATHEHINLSVPLQPMGVTLLECAYQKQSTECFQLLLTSGVFVDVSDKDGCTLLIRACDDRRKTEMVALLQAGASITKRSPIGFTAIGYLVMMDRRTPNIRLLQTFLENSRQSSINTMQGELGKRSTALCFACQKDWHEAATILLKFKADPTIVRETDLNNALAISVGKGFLASSTAILEHSTIPLANILKRALDIASQLKHHAIVTLLNNYIKTKQINLAEESELVGVISPGSDLNTVFRALSPNQSSFFPRLGSQTYVPASIVLKPAPPPPNKPAAKR